MHQRDVAVAARLKALVPGNLRAVEHADPLEIIGGGAVVEFGAADPPVAQRVVVHPGAWLVVVLEHGEVGICDARDEVEPDVGDAPELSESRTNRSLLGARPSLARERPVAVVGKHAAVAEEDVDDGGLSLIVGGDIRIVVERAMRQRHVTAEGYDVVVAVIGCRQPADTDVVRLAGQQRRGEVVVEDFVLARREQNAGRIEQLQIGVLQAARDVRRHEPDRRGRPIGESDLVKIVVIAAGGLDVSSDRLV